MARIKAKERSPEEKLGIVLEFLRGTPASELCRKHGMSEGTLNKWQDRVLARGQRRQAASGSWKTRWRQRISS
jgi:DNA-directed RNA polymerase specialized sigma24 family protein